MSKLNPTVKIISILLLSFVSILCNNLSSHFYIISFIFILILLSTKNIYEYLKTLKSIFFLLISIFIINLFFISIEENIIIILRIIEICIYTNIVSQNTSIRELNDGIYNLLKNISFIPAKKLAFSLTLSISFFPVLNNISKKLYKTILLKRLNIEKTSLKTKLFILKSYINSLFIKTINKSNKVAEILELNLFNIDKENTNYFKYKLKINDVLYIFFMITSIILLLKNEVIL